MNPCISAASRFAIFLADNDDRQPNWIRRVPHAGCVNHVSFMQGSTLNFAPRPAPRCPASTFSAVQIFPPLPLSQPGRHLPKKIPWYLFLAQPQPSGAPMPLFVSRWIQLKYFFKHARWCWYVLNWVISTIGPADMLQIQLAQILIILSLSLRLPRCYNGLLP